MSVEEKFTTTSGKEITVHRHSSGEVESVSWNDGEGKHTLSELDIYDIYNALTDEDEDEDSGDDDSDD